MTTGGPETGKAHRARAAAHEASPPSVARSVGATLEQIADDRLALERKYAVKLADARQAALRLSENATKRERLLAGKLHDAEQVALQMSRAAEERLRRLSEALRSSQNETLQLNRALAARERELEGLRARIARTTRLIDDTQRMLGEATGSFFPVDSADDSAIFSRAAGRIDQLLTLRGRHFIDHAYRSLLHRNPDPAGFRHYLDELCKGVSPVEIVRRIRYSPEGKAVAVDVRAVRARLAVAFLYRIPLAGRLLEAIGDAASLVTFARRRRAFEHSVMEELERAKAANVVQSKCLQRLQQLISRVETSQPTSRG